MDVWLIAKQLFIYSGILVLLEGLVVSVWFGSSGFLAAAGAWIISTLNMVFLSIDGRHLLEKRSNDARRAARKKAGLRLLTVGALVLALALVLEQELGFTTVGMIFLGVYLSVLIVFILIIMRTMPNRA